MLSCEGNENGEKTTIGLIGKKATLHVQHTFLYICLPLFCTTTTWNLYFICICILFLLHPIDYTLVVQYHLVQG